MTDVAAERTWTSGTALALALCRPPGMGWATSRAGHAPFAAELHERRYGTATPAEVDAAWRNELSNATAPDVAVLGVPYDQGSYGLHGAASGPVGIRLALDAGSWSGVAQPGIEVVDLGDVPFLPGPPLDELWSADALDAIRRARFGGSSHARPVSMLSIHAAMSQACADARVPLLSLGGDHSISATSWVGVADHRTGLVHIDAHPDLSHDRDGLSLLHNTWMHHADRARRISHVAQLGCVSDVDAPWLDGRRTRIPPDVLCGDPAEAARRCLNALHAANVDRVFLSVDIDALVIEEAPATGLPGGALTTAGVSAFVEELGARIPVVAADIVEVAPALFGRDNWASERSCLNAARICRAVLAVLRVAD